MADATKPDWWQGRRVGSTIQVSLVLIARFIRADTLGASVTMVLLGAATAHHQLRLGLVPGLVAVALSFHLYAYLLNDVVDLPLDRTDPRRAANPLVLGLVSPRTALMVAWLQIPISVLVVAALGGRRSELATLLVLFAAVTVYDLWGKRCPVPPLTDLVQGMAWASLGWLAADVVGATTEWTVLLSVFFLAFILLANGVHGSIRDLANDRRCGASTTATWFGAEIRPGGAVRLGAGYLGYALGLQAVTVGLPFLPTVLGWDGAPGSALLWPMGVASLLSTGFLVLAAQATDRHRQLVRGTWHLILVLVPLFLLLVPRLPVWAIGAAAACYLLPFATYRWIFRPRPEPGSHWTVERATAP